MFATGLVGLCCLLLLASGAWSEEPKASGSCVARVDVYQGGSKKTSFSKMFRYKARVRPNTRECSVVDWQLSWDYHRKDNGRLEKDAMLLATTVERGDGNATEEGEIQEDTNDTELNFRAENVSCRLCDEKRANTGTSSAGGAREPAQAKKEDCERYLCVCSSANYRVTRAWNESTRSCESPQTNCASGCSEHDGSRGTGILLTELTPADSGECPNWYKCRCNDGSYQNAITGLEWDNNLVCPPPAFACTMICKSNGGWSGGVDVHPRR